LSNSNSEYKIVSTSVASVYSKPNFNSEIVTQALIWEKIIILDKKQHWLNVELQDGYLGWIHSFFTVDKNIYNDNKDYQIKSNWYWVISKFANLKSNIDNETMVSFGSLIPCFNDNNNFFTILPNKEKIIIDKRSIVKYGSTITLKHIINYSQKLIGIPYLWGGKSVFGFDCSGLLQAIMKVGNILLPRDTKDQINSKVLQKIKFSNILCGDIIFFEKNNLIVHVGLYVDNEIFIHSSGCVKYGSINKNSKYFSNELENLDYKFYRLKNVK